MGTIGVILAVVALGLWGTLLTDKQPVSNANASLDSKPVTQVEDQQKNITAKSVNSAHINKRELINPVVNDASEFDSLINTHSANADTFSAFANLFALWQRDYSAYTGDTACTRALKAGMRCIFGRDEFTAIVQYNRPAVLELHNNKDEVLFVVLHKIQNDQATIRIADKNIQLPISQLEQAWSGSYIALWKPPFPENESLAKGFIGPDVLWVRHQLDQIEGKKKAEYSADNLQFDDQLEGRVTKFQQTQGLKADGIVGRETFIELVNINNTNNIPKLTMENKG